MQSRKSLSLSAFLDISFSFPCTPGCEMSAPLAKTDQIVLIGGGNNTTHEVNKLMGTLPPAIQALTGVDLTGALGKIPGATMAK
jgi:hypothetical protein